MLVFASSALLTAGAPDESELDGTWEQAVSDGLTVENSSMGDSTNRTIWHQRQTPKSDFRVHDALAVDDGYVIAGDVSGSTSSHRPSGLVRKVDHAGDTVWDHRFNETTYAISAIEKRPDGGVVVAGESDVRSTLNVGTGWVGFLDEEGNRERLNKYGPGEIEDVVGTTQGGYLAVGQMDPKGEYVLKLGPSGNELWREEFNGTALNGAVETLDRDGFLVLTADTSIRRIDRSGDLEWTRSLDHVADGLTVIRQRGEGYVLGANNGTVLFVSKEGDVREVGSIPRFADDAVQSIRFEDEYAYFGSDAGLARVRIDDGDFPGRVERVNEEVRSSPLGSIEAILPADNGHTVVVGSVEAEYRYQGVDGYVAKTDQRPPVADVSVNTTSAEVGVTPVTVSTTARDNDGVRVYRWDFDGDGEWDDRATESETTHVYQEVGTWNTRVEVLDYDDNLAVVSETLEVVDTTKPNVALSDPNPRFVATTAPAILDARGSSDNHGIAAYEWDFDGDGEPDRVTNSSRVSHHFDSPGNHSVELTVVDETGHENASAYRLRTAENQPPNVSVDSGLLVQDRSSRLSATTTTDRVGTPNVTWHLPNDSRAVGHEIEYTFPDAGTYNLTVVARDEYGGETVRNVTLEVRATYPADDIGPRQAESDSRTGMPLVLLTAITALLLLIYNVLL